MIQSYLFTSFQCDDVCLFSSSNLWPALNLSRVQALSMEQHSLEPQELRARAGGSVGGTLPLGSARAWSQVPLGSRSRSSAGGGDTTQPRLALLGPGTGVCQWPGGNASCTGSVWVVWGPSWASLQQKPPHLSCAEERSRDHL